LTGRHPILLAGEDKKAYKKSMKSYDGINLHKHDMSKMAADLVKKMCKLKAKDRPEIDEVLEHPWMLE
jgi:hypothetical protein